MATRILTTDGTYITGTWYQVEAGEFPPNINASSQGGDELSTERTVAITPANAGNQVGIFLAIWVTANNIGTITIKLQEYVGATWTTRTTDTLAVNATNFPVTGNISYNYVPLKTYALTAVAATWRYAISCDVSNRVRLMKCYPSNAYSIGAVLDASTATPSSGDVLYIADGKIFSVDQSITTTNIVLCNGAIFTWQAPVSSYTLTFSGGAFYPSGACIILIGSTGAGRIPVAQRATIITGGFLTYPASGSYSSFFFKLYGATDANLAAEISAWAPATQKNIVTTTDMSAIWSNGDTLVFYGKNRAGSDATNTIASMSGTTITLTNNLDYGLFAGGLVVNSTRAAATLGIAITGGTTIMQGSACYGQAIISGAVLTNISFSGTDNIYYAFKSSSNTAGDELSYIYWTSSGNCLINISSNYLTMNHVYASNMSARNTMHLYVNNASISNVANKYEGVATIVYPFYLSGNNNTVTNVCVAQGRATDAYYLVQLLGASNTFTNLRVFAAKDATYISQFNSTFTACRFEGATQKQIVYGNCIGITFTNCTIGAVVSATYDHYLTSNALIQVLFVNCTLTSAIAYNIASAVNGSYLRWHTYNATANQHNCYEKYGNQISVGDGLLDTNLHTAGAGKFAIRFEPLSSATNLEWTFTVPTGNIAAKTMTISVWVKIASATYYANTHEKPRLTINYDNGTLAYAEAVASTAWQQLIVNFTPATSYGQVTVTVSGRTDALTTNAYFYVDDCALAYPAGVALDLGGLDNWANALPVTPPLALPLSAYSVAVAMWEELLAGHLTVGSFGKVVGTYLDAAISSRGTSTLTEAGVRTAVGLVGANLDTQLSDGADKADVTALTAAIAAIPTNPYTGVPPTVDAIADAVLDEDVAGHTGWLTKLLSVAKFMGLK